MLLKHKQSRVCMLSVRGWSIYALSLLRYEPGAHSRGLICEFLCKSEEWNQGLDLLAERCKCWQWEVWPGFPRWLEPKVRLSHIVWALSTHYLPTPEPLILSLAGPLAAWNHWDFLEPWSTFRINTQKSLGSVGNQGFGLLAKDIYQLFSV